MTFENVTPYIAIRQGTDQHLFFIDHEKDLLGSFVKGFHGFFDCGLWMYCYVFHENSS
jgi:hypothetical protein